MDPAKFEHFRKSASAIREVVGGLVSFDFGKCRDGVSIDALWSEAERQAGHAGRAMRSLLVLADAHGITLRLVPHWLAYDVDAMAQEGLPVGQIELCERLNRARLTNEQLQDWYARLGFEKTGEIDRDDPVMVRHPCPSLVLYHSAPRTARESIMEHGISPRFSETAELAMEMGEPDWENYGAVFVTTVPEDNPRVDIWAVEASGLLIEPDDTTECPSLEESWWKLYADVDPVRLSIFAPAAEAAPVP